MNKYWFYKVGLVVVFLCFALLGGAKVKLPTLVSDGMVLQRGEPVNIWGTADPDETVDITFLKMISNYRIFLLVMFGYVRDSRIWNCLFHGLQIVFAMKYLRTVTIRWYAI